MFSDSSFSTSVFPFKNVKNVLYIVNKGATERGINWNKCHDLELVNNFKTILPNISDIDCICRGRETGFKNRGGKMTPSKSSVSESNIVSQSSFVAESSSVSEMSSSSEPCTDVHLMCHLISRYGLCNKEHDRIVSINEVDFVVFFNLPVELPRDVTMSVMLCQEHRLNFFHRQNTCYICDKRFTSKIKRFSFCEDMTIFVQQYMSHIPGNDLKPDELNTSKQIVCGGCYHSVKKYMADNYKSESTSSFGSHTPVFEIVRQKWSECIYSSNAGLSICIITCFDAFLDHRPVLLAHLYKEFLQNSLQTESENTNQRWLLQTITDIFSDSISIITDDFKRMGTMLKRVDNNDNKALHNLLFYSNEISDKKDGYKSKPDTALVSKEDILSVAKVLREKLVGEKQQYNTSYFD